MTDAERTEQPDGAATGPGPLPDRVRTRVVGLAADALGRMAVEVVPPSLVRVATFAPQRRARLAASQIASVLAADEGFRDRVAADVRDHGIGTRIFHDLFEHATREAQTISLRVERRNERATMLYSHLGFDLVSVDDLDNHFEWAPATAVKEDRVPVAVKEDRVPVAVKEDASARTGDHSRS